MKIYSDAYVLRKLSGLRWCVICPDKSEFKTSSLTEALEFIRKHIEANGEPAS